MSRIGRGSVQFLLTVMHKIMYIFVWYLSHGFVFKFMRYIHVGTFQFACIICENFAAYYSSSFLFYVIWIHFSLY